MMKRSFCVATVLALLMLCFGALTVSAASEGAYTYTVANEEATITAVNDSVGAEVEIPASLGGYPVTAIGDDAFSRKQSIRTVIIPSTIKTIGENAFYGCTGITRLSIASGVESIGKLAFYGCDGLQEVVIPDTVTTMGRNAFYDCNALKSVTLSKGLEVIPTAAFGQCGSLEEIVIPDGVVEVGGTAFSSSGIKRVVLPSSVQKFENNAFFGCTQLQAVYIDDLKWWCELTFGSGEASPMRHAGALYIDGVLVSGAVTIPEGTTQIAQDAFSGCTDITSFAIPSSVKSIGEHAFSGCTGLPELTIPDSVISIGQGAFYGCTALKKLTVPFVDYSLENLFRATYANYDEEVVPPSLEEVVLTKQSRVYNTMFSGCDSLKKVVLSDATTEVSQWAFNDCVGLTSLHFPKNVTTVTASAFSGCSNLKTITVEEGNTAYVVEDGVLFTADKRTLVFYPAGKTETTYTIPSGVETVSLHAFRNVKSLTEITVSDSVTTIEEGVFQGCENLAKVSFGSGVATIGEYVFEGCSALTAITVDNRNMAFVSVDGVLFDKNKTTLIRYPAKKTEATYTIPATITVIKSLAFEDADFLTEMTIPLNVETVGRGALYGCDSIRTLTTPFVDSGDIHITFDTVGYLFRELSLSNTKAPVPSVLETVEITKAKEIGQYAFHNIPSLKSVRLPDGVTRVGSFAFEGCTNLETVNIPSSVKTLGTALFRGCEKLRVVNIPYGVTELRQRAFDGATGLEEVTIPDSVTQMPFSLFTECPNLKKMTLPFLGASDGCDAKQAHLGYIFGVYSPGYHAEQLPVSLEEVVLTKARTIRQHAFAGCEFLKKVYLPATVTSVEEYAFKGCTSLTDIIVDDSNTSYCSVDGVLYNRVKAKLIAYPIGKPQKEYTVLPTVTTIYPCAFYGATLEKLTTPVVGGFINDPEHLGLGYIFDSNTLQRDAVPSTLKTVVVTNAKGIGDRTFYECKNLKSVVLPDGLKRIGEDTFYNCRALESIVIPDSVTEIGKNAFELCVSLSDVTIGSGVTTISEYAFSACPLKNINIPEAMTSIGSHAFSGCDTLERVDITNLNAWCEIAFVGATSNPMCYAKSLYCNGTLLTGKVVLPSTLTVVKPYTFYNCSGITGVQFAKGTTDISAEAFYGCSGLTSLTIPSTVTSIHPFAFYGCSSLKTVTIPKDVTYIGNAAFGDCTGLTRVNYNATDCPLMGGYSQGAFEGSLSLKTVVIGSNVTAIPAYAFGGCKGLESVTIPAGIKTVGEYAFMNCYALTTVYYNAVNCTMMGTEYGSPVFPWCDALKTVVVGDAVTSIPPRAFYGCKQLETVKIPIRVTAIGENVFYRCSKVTVHGYANSYAQTYAKANNVPFKVLTCQHKYSSSCDTSCNVCGVTRTIAHTYKATTTKATLAANGKIVKKCSVCGKVSSTTAIQRPTSFKLSATSYTYNGAVKTPTVTVKDTAGKVLKKDTDYTVTYASGRKNAGTYTVKITMKGNYSGTKTLSFKINPIDISKCSVKLSATSYTYNGAVKTPSVVVKNANGTTLTKNTHYTVTYATGRKNAGTYKVTVKMKGNYSGTKTLTFKINPINISKCKLSLSATAYTYDGKVKAPTVTVKNASGTKLTKNTHYTVTYASGRKNVGTYKVTVKMKGNYTGTKTLTFKINPAKTTVSKITPAAKSLKVAITKKSTQVTGYQIQYSTSKTFKSVKTVNISSYKTTSTTIKSLKAKTTYYVRVRTYKTVSGTKYYSGWSTVKYAKTK